MIWALVAVVALAAATVAFLWVRRRSAAKPETPPATPTRSALGDRLGSLLRRGLGESAWRDLEELLLAADVGVAATEQVVAAVRDARPADVAEARTAIKSELLRSFVPASRELGVNGSPAVMVVVGVNGTGKTTTIAKVAALLVAGGKSVLLGAADTFRAAAGEQLRTWADRLGVDSVIGEEGADPASVAFDAVAAARARGTDVVIVDTAGRLHVKRNLMDELSKIVRVLEREAAVTEILLVIDGTAGQNGIAQARTFSDAVAVTGVAVTKLDGTAKGGIAVAIEKELGIPLKLIGVGESPGDLLHFDPDSYVDSLLEGA